MKTFEFNTNLKTERNKYQIEDSNRELGSRTFLFPRHSDVHCIKGFIEYACFCYQNHYGFVISPTDIMYMVQAELAAAVKKTPDDFASMFTTTPGTKQEIVTMTGSPEEIDVDAVIEQLRERVPTNVDLFLPEFSTTTIPAQLATHVAFCDMVSPYYNYSTFLCGIPTVEVAGTEEDWKLLNKTLYDLSELFTGDLKKYLGRVWNRTTDILNECKRGNGALFTQMVSMNKCGSGSQYEITGWILEFMNKDGKRCIMEMLQNVHRHLSKMSYKNLDTGRTFDMYAGIFYCELYGTVAKPVYNATRIETTKGMDEKPKKRGFEVYSSPITAQVRKVPYEFKVELEQDIQAFYHVDAEKALVAAANAAAESKRAKKKKS